MWNDLIDERNNRSKRSNLLELMKEPHGDWKVIDTHAIRVIDDLAQFIKQSCDELGTLHTEQVKLGRVSMTVPLTIDGSYNC